MPAARDRRSALDAGLVDFSNNVETLKGLPSNTERAVLVGQLIDSIRRVEYVKTIGGRKLAPQRQDPQSDLFDPLMAAALFRDQGDFDEACWLVFLATYYGKHRRAGWSLARDTYGRLGKGPTSTWARTAADPAELGKWMSTNAHQLLRPGISFGNHRKYESLKASAPQSPEAVVRAYVEWIGPNRGHALKFQDARNDGGQDPEKTFDILYRSVGRVPSFGRITRFDYLTMLGKLNLVDMRPGIPYLTGATGPLQGARLLFDGHPKSSSSPRSLDQRVRALGLHLGLGMQEMEDAICNWQKSPASFVRFSG